MIYENADGTYSHTSPIHGETDAVDPGGPSACPGKTKPVAYYHTHGGPDPRYDNENFSGEDIDYADHYEIDGYVGTPGGRMGKYERKTKSTTYKDRTLPVK